MLVVKNSNMPAVFEEFRVFYLSRRQAAGDSVGNMLTKPECPTSEELALSKQSRCSP